MIDIVDYSPDAPLPPKLADILGRQAGIPEEIEEAVRDIISDVRRDGDAALVRFSERFDGVVLSPEQFLLPPAQLQDALQASESDLVEAINAAAANIRAFHERQRINSWFMEDGDSVVLGKKVTPIRRVGICVPGGAAPLISSLLMAVVPAQVAGVEEICIVTPPQENGLPHPDLLATAALLGVAEVYALGGAHAVAALAYGTDSIRSVDKIVGPGGPYTVAAKRQVYGVVGIEMVPGPSEIVVLADAAADPSFVAADLLSQAEHGTGLEASICITNSASVAAAVQREVETQAAELPRHELIEAALTRFGAIVCVSDLDVGVDLVNRLAPEHLELLVDEPWAWLSKIRDAGAVFLGEAATEPVGDYYAGTNHVLPTNGAARFASSLGLSDFVKTSSIVAYSRQRLEKTGDHITRLARAEGFEAHARAVEVRLERWRKS
ncbi:MAG: histidinol dehydrogenase [Gemmatimonadetes bacterium]|jgi:histidinol dehydrogenase|nr:histidinol dehydrogenase [Gemmatimonadota bacterium]MBT5056022.1 histidinol dehydrogenase [Gemmatimonadota bacterium]MBT5143216.1 histidinol dehydrogenase [Gemmatimonadota bacterium]MBT5586850.1 histidinol dehydrogenase [Gemmatimonadota bacterium]MBT5960973.1 histidinol dehydrogenase [Gemmatimonadota bacterium]